MSAMHAIGVDLGGTKILAGIVTREGKVLKRHERPSPQDSQDSVIRELSAAVEELMEDEVGALGFGVPWSGA
jgi:glucokinase